MYRFMVGLIPIFLFSSSAFAVPMVFSHQGRVLSSDQAPLSGSANVTYKLYTNETGGSAIWTQTMAVTFDDGYYSIALGPGTPTLSSDIFDGRLLYLGISLESAQEFEPRHPVGSVPYAVRAGSVTGEVNADSGLFVNGHEVVDSDGNITSVGTLTMPMGAFSELPSPSESNKGQFFYATDQDVAYYSNGSEWLNLQGGGGGGDWEVPVINSVSPEQIEPGQSVTVTFNGQGFKDGCEVDFAGVLAEDVNFVDAGQVEVSSGELDSGSYTVRLTNPENLRGILVDGLVVDGAPVWVTEPGSLGLFVDAVSGDHVTLEATDPESQTLTYSVIGGSLPTGLSLNSETGVISGDPEDVNEDVEYEFEIRVTDTAATPNTTDISLSMTITDLLGQVAEAPGESCKHLLDSGSSLGDGVYWINPPTWNGDSFQVYCEMDRNGGGWTLVLSAGPGINLVDAATRNSYSPESLAPLGADSPPSSTLYKFSDTVINQIKSRTDDSIGYWVITPGNGDSGGDSIGAQIFHRADCVFLMFQSTSEVRATTCHWSVANTYTETPDWKSGGHWWTDSAAYRWAFGYQSAEAGVLGPSACYNGGEGLGPHTPPNNPLQRGWCSNSVGWGQVWVK